MEDVTVATFGDMLKVPGSRESLADARAAGADIRVVYSPLDALAVARDLAQRGQRFDLIVSNPPYGERIGEEAEMETLYKTIGDTLKTNFQGYNAFVFTGNLEAAKSIGLKPARRVPLFNGPIDCRRYM